MWIEIHDDLPAHPKVADLGARMGWTSVEAVGRLVSLWLWVAKYAPTGDLRQHSAHRLALAMGVPFDDADKLLRTLVEVRLLDAEPVLRVHDWWSYAGRYLRIKFKDSPERWRDAQQLYTGTNPVTGSVTGPVAGPVTGPVGCTTNQPTNRTGPDQPDQTGPNNNSKGRGGRKPRQLRLVMGAPAISAECQAVVDAWNELGAPFPAVRALTPERCAALAERMGEEFFASNWRAALERMAASPFHRGGGARRWVANLDWFVGRPEAVVHLMELPASELIDAAAAARRAAF